MEKDELTLHLHHGARFVKGRKLKYEGGDLRSIYLFDMDKCSYWEWKGLAKDVGYDGPIDFFYL